MTTATRKDTSKTFATETWTHEGRHPATLEYYFDRKNTHTITLNDGLPMPEVFTFTTVNKARDCWTGARRSLKSAGFVRA
jgi:hypothetical protein